MSDDYLLVKAVVDRAKAHGVETLWHYTNAPGLMGILASGALHATSINHQNDLHEVEYFADILENKFADQMDQLELAYASEVMRIEARFRKLSYIGCLSEDGDQFSQWQSYGDAQRGFAIGFNLEKLAQFLSPGMRIALTPVWYEVDQKAQDVVDAFNRAYSFGVSGFLGVSPQQSISKKNMSDMKAIAYHRWQALQEDSWVVEAGTGMVSGKSEGWSSEREWRIISRVEIDQPLKFAAAGSEIRKYVEVKFQENPWNTAISEIRLGPKSATSLEIVSELVSNLGYPPIHVSRSRIKVK